VRLLHVHWSTKQLWSTVNWLRTMNSLRLSAGALALGLSSLVGAQAMAAAPAGAKAPAASLIYQSAFADYKPYQDVPPGDWKALNDSVRDSGEGQMNMGSMDISHDTSMPANREAAKAASPSAPMHMESSHSMPGKKPAGKSSSPAPMQMDGAHPMPGAKP
jgi:hypothetical protein